MRPYEYPRFDVHESPRAPRGDSPLGQLLATAGLVLIRLGERLHGELIAGPKRCSYTQ